MTIRELKEAFCDACDRSRELQHLDLDKLEDRDELESLTSEIGSEVAWLSHTIWVKTYGMESK